MLKEKKLLLLASEPEEIKDLSFLNKLAKAKFNWKLFLKLAKKNSLITFLYRNLKRYSELDFFPEFVKEKIKGIYYYNLARNIFILEELKHLLKVFNSEGIKLVGLKGLFLSEFLYNNIDIKPTTDIDLLVQIKDLKLIDKILCSLGYKQPPYFKDFLFKKEITPINSLVYNNCNLGIFIHLHTHIINTTLPIEFFVEKISIEKIWQKIVQLNFWETKVYMLSFQHLLLHLIHHGACHNFNKLLFYYDIKQLITKYKDLIKKEILKEEFEKFYSWELANFVFFRIEKLFKIKLPFKENCFNLATLLCNFKIPSYFFYFILLPNLKYKLNFIKKTFFPSSYVIAQNLNLSLENLKPHHYFFRIFDKILLRYFK
ncbi:MAG: nucleotidyltransferase family protein [Candidatus Aenigmatarchaeota archaeon]